MSHCRMGTALTVCEEEVGAAPSKMESGQLNLISPPISCLKGSLHWSKCYGIIPATWLGTPACGTLSRSNAGYCSRVPFT